MEEKNSNEGVYKASFQHNTIPSFILNENLHIIDVNLSFCDLLKYSPEALLSKSLDSLLSDKLDYETIVQRLMSSEDILIDLISIQDAKGSLIKLKLEIKKLYHLSNTRFYGCLYQEDSAECDDDVIFRETLTSTRQIARSIGHEIRNPLTNLTLAIDQLEEELDVEEDSQLYFNIINRNALRIEQFIVDMLEAIKVVEIHPAFININQSVSSWVALIKEDVQFDSIDLKIQLQPDLA